MQKLRRAMLGIFPSCHKLITSLSEGDTFSTDNRLIMSLPRDNGIVLVMYCDSAFNVTLQSSYRLSVAPAPVKLLSLSSVRLACLDLLDY